MTTEFIKVPLADLHELEEEFNRADFLVNRIMIAVIEEDLSHDDFEYNMHLVSSWLDDKEKQIQKLIATKEG